MAKPSAAAMRCPRLLGLQLSSRALVSPRRYSTHNTLGSSAPAARRKAVTPFNDDGHVPWTELSAGEKTARAAQQTFNFGMVIVGIALTVGSSGPTGAGVFAKPSFQSGVVYFLYTEVFSPDSKVSYFNRAVDRIKRDPRCLEVLGDSKKITAYGEPTWNKWRRSRPIAYVGRTIQQGTVKLISGTVRPSARTPKATTTF